MEVGRRQSLALLLALSATAALGVAVFGSRARRPALPASLQSAATGVGVPESRRKIAMVALIDEFVIDGTCFDSMSLRARNARRSF